MDRRVRLAPKATSQKGSSGIYKSGYNLPPVALPGMTPEVLKRFKTSSKATSLMKKMKASTLAKTKAMSKSVPGRFYANSAAWAAAGAAHDALLSTRVVDENMEDFWNVADQIKSVVSTGAMYVNPLLGVFLGPIIEGVAQLSQKVLQNNNTDYLAYKSETEKQRRKPVSYDEWNKWRTEKNGENNGGSCQIITVEMLGGKTVEEYMAERGIEPAKDNDNSPPDKGPLYTEEEEENLKKIGTVGYDATEEEQRKIREAAEKVNDYFW
jgi:hypothetical protein